MCPSCHDAEIPNPRADNQCFVCGHEVTNEDIFRWYAALPVPRPLLEAEREDLALREGGG